MLTARCAIVGLVAVSSFASITLADGRVAETRSSVYRDGVWDNGAGPVYIYYYNQPNNNPFFEMRNTNYTLAQAQAAYNNGTIGFTYFDNNGAQQNYAGANANTMQDHSTNYGWNVNFSIFCLPTTVQVDMHLNLNWTNSGLNAAQQAARQTQYEQDMESWWSHRYGINDGTITRNINFDVRFDAYAQAPLYDQTVNILAGSGRSDLGTWYVNDDAATSSHEFGHALGAYDEYWGGALAGTLVTDYANLMGTVTGLVSGQGLKPIYFDEILLQFTEHCSPTTTNTLIQVPTPGGMILIGLGGIFAVRRRRS